MSETSIRLSSVTTQIPLTGPCNEHITHPKKDAALSAPQHPRFADLMDRLMSFDDPQWPFKCPVRPEDLAAAGFYYYGK